MKNYIIENISAFENNYIYILKCLKSNKIICIDPGTSNPVIEFMQKKQWKIDFIILTHRCFDHIGGATELQKKYNAEIFIHQIDTEILPNAQHFLNHNQIINLGNLSAKIIHTPGHQDGHVTYYFQKEKLLFPGDTLFQAGCGRLHTGTHQQIFNSLNILKQLPEDTLIYAAHEYTEKNISFALQYEPNNINLIKRLAEVKKLSKEGCSSYPSTIDLEKKINPFLRTDSQEIRSNLNLQNANDLEVFTKLRKLKDVY